MAESYWISRVDGCDCVGAPDMFMRDVYEGEEYAIAEDNDLRDRQYSTLAACGTDPTEWDAVSADTAMYDISLVDQKEYNEAVSSLWDTESEVAGSFDNMFMPRARARNQRLIEETTAKLEAYHNGTPEYRAEIEKIWANRKRGGGGIFGSVGDGLENIGRSVKKIGGDMVHTLNTVAQLPATAVRETLGRIPIIGEPITAAVNLSPEVALGGLTSRVLSGERIDRAFLNTAKSQIKAARTLAPYVQTVMSVVPGVGTGVAAAIAAGTAIAEGRTITEAVLSGVRGAIPGGPVAAAAFDTAVAITKGKSLDKAALDAVKGQLPAGAREAVDIIENVSRGQNIGSAALGAAKRRLPPAARRAVDAAVQVGKGANAKDLILQVVRAELPAQTQRAFEVGTAMGAARTIQSQIVGASVTKNAISKFAKHGSKILAKGPKGLRKATKGLSKTRKAGFMAAVGAASKSGNSSHALAATRNRLGISQQRGFDHGMRTIAEQIKGKNWGSMVSRGRVMRGKWRPTRSNIPGAVQGRVVQNRKVKAGWFRRV